MFIDEIHRFNKAQQDVLLPYDEEGAVTLIGATTHNPFFFVNSPLVSRSQIFELQPLTEADLLLLLQRALADAERGLGYLKIQADDAALHHLARVADGDARPPNRASLGDQQERGEVIDARRVSAQGAVAGLSSACAFTFGRCLLLISACSIRSICRSSMTPRVL